MKLFILIGFCYMNKLDKQIIELLNRENQFKNDKVTELSWIRCVEFNKENYEKITVLITENKLSELLTFDEVQEGGDISDDILIYNVKSKQLEYTALIKDFFELFYTPIILDVFLKPNSKKEVLGAILS